MSTTTYDVQHRRLHADGFRHCGHQHPTVHEAARCQTRLYSGNDNKPDSSIVAIVDGKYRQQPACGERELGHAERAELNAWHGLGGYRGLVDMAPYVAASQEEAAWYAAGCPGKVSA